MTVEVVLYLASGMGVALTALATWAWNHTHKSLSAKADEAQVARIEEAIRIITLRIDAEVRCARNKFETKADEDEMVRQRGHIENLFTGQEKIRAEMNTGFINLTEKVNSSHLVLIDKLSEIIRK